MERWTWPYIAQQIVLLGAWCWLMRTAWREVRGGGGDRGMKTQVTIRLDPDDMERIRALAQKDNRPVSNYIGWVLTQHLKAFQEGQNQLEKA